MKNILNVVHPKDVEVLFQNLGLSALLHEGEIKCSACDLAISADSFRAVKKREEKLFFYCNKTECYRALYMGR